ncbi:MAG TPA: type IV toxin-antitoxin system AbiEi family antitoxin domain-containing protein [Microlunatus sp.]|nr:type IV toxin-antitoxin system AbiEi family antitoxin domain-containing protein [Microlunatus sp.]
MSLVPQIWTTNELRRRGFESPELARLVRSGELTRIRRGAYGPPEPQAPPVTLHRRLIEASIGELGPGAVLSHGSAAVMHGLPVWATAIERVHVTRDRGYGARQRRSVDVHGAGLTADDITVVDGVTVTSLARTVLDLGRTRSWEQAVAAGDRALAIGLGRDDLDRCLDRMRGWPGSRQAARVSACLDPASESPGESVSRVRLVEQGLPSPILQYVVRDDRGQAIARSDFAWEEYRTIGEFDGKVKYGRLLRPGERIDDVVFAEKQREDAIRDQGWQVVRWLWDDLYRPGVIGDRVRRAFARSAA